MNKQANPTIKEGSFSSEECVVLTENDYLTVAVFIKHDDDVESYFGSDHYSYKAKTGHSWELEA
jgi:hypothetical protein